jgi:hypothetical protein
MNFYQFISPGRLGGGFPKVCVGPVSTVIPLMNQQELMTLFGGYVCYVDATTGANYIGVFGARKAARFHRILSERGAPITLRRGFPSQLRMTSWAG